MNHRHIGTICQLAGAAIAIAGLIAVAVLLNPWRNAERASQLDEIYFGTNLPKSGIIALAGIAAAYILLRVGSHLKSKRKGDSTSAPGPQDAP